MTGILSDARLGYVHLTVSDLNRALGFYQHAIGLQIHHRNQHSAVLGAGGAPLVALTENPTARRMHGTSGLHHFAILVPSRLELAKALRRISDSGLAPQGLVDHGVSEAVYFRDPDGNGIEIYRDRPRIEWRYRDGQLEMAANPLDLDAVRTELDTQTESPGTLDPTSVIGHVHVYVANRRDAEAFYVGLLGFNLQLHTPTASFVSTGGYHHHIALNTSAGVGAPPPGLNAIGLRYFVVHVPDADALSQVAGRARKAGLALRETTAGWLVRDPSHNGILLRAGVAQTMPLWEGDETIRPARRFAIVDQRLEGDRRFDRAHVPTAISRCIGDRFHDNGIRDG